MFMIALYKDNSLTNWRAHYLEGFDSPHGFLSFSQGQTRWFWENFLSSNWKWVFHVKQENHVESLAEVTRHISKSGGGGRDIEQDLQRQQFPVNDRTLNL